VSIVRFTAGADPRGATGDELTESILLPKNYRSIDRDERVDRLLDAAAEQFLTVGYAGTTMAQIARGAGLTSPALYWYFPSKDGALVAVQRRVLASTRARIADPLFSPMVRLERYLEIIREEARPLHRMLHERSQHSEDVADVLDEIHHEIEGLIRAAVHARSELFPETETVINLSMAVIEGTSAVSAPTHSSELVRWAIERLVPEDNRRLDTSKPAPIRS
jgi:TetR/AcrR family transcriptional repressor of mexAB-oprM operon